MNVCEILKYIWAKVILYLYILGEGYKVCYGYIIMIINTLLAINISFL